MSRARPFVGSIERVTEQNRAYRRVVRTGSKMQLVVMSLGPGEEIASEIHPRTDQFVRIEEGSAVLVLDGRRHKLKAGDAAVIPAGMRHHVINASRTRPLKLYTIYAPPEHPHGTVQMRRRAAGSPQRKRSRDRRTDHRTAENREPS